VRDEEQHVVAAQQCRLDGDVDCISGSSPPGSVCVVQNPWERWYKADGFGVFQPAVRLLPTTP
jgi:hypothetical protein